MMPDDDRDQCNPNVITLLNISTFVEIFFKPGRQENQTN